ILTFAPFSLIPPMNEARVDAGTATEPDSSTLAGIEISIPKSRLVARIVTKFVFSASKRMQDKTGRVMCFPDIRSASTIASFIFSCEHSTFIFVLYLYKYLLLLLVLWIGG